MYHVFVDKFVGNREIHKFKEFLKAEDFGNWILSGLNVKAVRIYAHGNGSILAQGYEGDNRLW